MIIEDEEHAALRLSKMLKELEPGIEINGPLDTIKNSVLHLQEKMDYDLIFLDIQLADGRSFSIFEQININNPVIFTTAYDEFAVKAFELNSVDYLLKPIHQERLKTALLKFKKMKEVYGNGETSAFLNELLISFKSQQEKQYQSRFLVSKADSLIPVQAEEVAYFYAEDKVVFLVKSEGSKYIVNYTLDDLENRVNPKQFFRVNRQYLVSVHAIKKVHHYFNYKLKLDLSPISDEDVVVSKLRTSDFKMWMNG